MASYQNDTATKGNYTPVSFGNGSSDGSGGKSMRKWIIAGVLVVLVGVVLIVTLHKPPGSSTQAAMAQADLPVNKDGSLMLFDDLSECCFVLRRKQQVMGVHDEGASPFQDVS